MFVCEVTFVQFQKILTSAICVTMLIASSSDQIYSGCVSGLKYFFCIERGWGGGKHISFKGEMICYIKILAKLVIYIILSVAD